MKIGDVVDMRSCATVQELSIPRAAPDGRTMKFLYLGLDDDDWSAVLRGEMPALKPVEALEARIRSLEAHVRQQLANKK